MILALKKASLVLFLLHKWAASVKGIKYNLKQQF